MDPRLVPKTVKSYAKARAMLFQTWRALNVAGRRVQVAEQVFASIPETSRLARARALVVVEEHRADLERLSALLSRTTTYTARARDDFEREKARNEVVAQDGTWRAILGVWSRVYAVSDRGRSS